MRKPRFEGSLENAGTHRELPPLVLQSGVRRRCLQTSYIIGRSSRDEEFWRSSQQIYTTCDRFSKILSAFVKALLVMPPFVPRKRRASTPPETPTPPVKKQAKRETLFDSLESAEKNRASLDKNKAFQIDGDDEDSDSELSDIDSDEFEDVPGTTATSAAKKKKKSNSEDEDEDDDDEDDEDDEMEWEDAVHQSLLTPVSGPDPSGDLELTIDKNQTYDDTTLADAMGVKKGPSKIERQIRINAHCLHVQCLLAHNQIRNAWINDPELHRILLGQLPPGIQKEVEKWRLASGLSIPKPKEKEEKPTPKGKGKGRGRGQAAKKAADARSGRDWGEDSERLEPGKPDMSRGDPLIHLLKVLSAFWKKRFTPSAPGLRKKGYRGIRALRNEIASFKTDEHDAEKHGELIKDLDAFRKLAKECQGSRDVGEQLFTALLRAIGIEARMVANLQPIGFGWTKAEEMAAPTAETVNERESEDEESDQDEPQSSKKPATKGKKGRKKKQELEESEAEDSDASLIEITPRKPAKPTKKYDQDLPFPIYWTEAISPITHEVLPVEPLRIAHPVASTQDHLIQFEPRGSRAEKTKQVIAYVVAFSPDRSAKDVTTRYLKRHVWPGKTKGFRRTAEKIPILNKKGKVKRYEDYDWFQEVMLSFIRPDKIRTAVDDIEEAKDLKSAQIQKKVTKDDVDTLQSLRSSADFVLERFLRREEALRPGAQPVRTFKSGKGDKAKEENVYLRSDVMRCLSAESWHKEGRQPKMGEVALKFVPVRAVTMTRKREVEEHQRQTGEKPTQGLYALEQTEYIIPPPIQNGVIPKNAYGNIDCFVETMVPAGAVHVPLRGTMRICRKLGIDFAEAVTGFEFGNKMAVPVIEGVVIAAEHEQAVREAWVVEAAEKQRREDEKHRKLVLGMWRKYLMGLRIKERFRKEYGEEGEQEVIERVNTFIVASGGKKKGTKSEQNHQTTPEEEGKKKGEDFIFEDEEHGGGGGFFADGDEPEEEEGSRMERGELEVEHGDQVNGHDPFKPIAHDASGMSSPLSDAPEIKRSDVDEAEDVKQESDLEDDQEPIPSPPPKSTRKKATPKKADATPKKQTPRKQKKTVPVVEVPAPSRRTAPRRSTRGVRSKYFEGDSEEEGEESEELSV